MTRFLHVPLSVFLAGVSLLNAEEPPRKEPPRKEPKKEAAPAKPAAAPPKAAFAPARTRHPAIKRATPASVKSEYAAPRVEPAVSRRPPVVWEKEWASPVSVEWEDAPAGQATASLAKDPSPNLIEELNAIRKDLDELTQMVRYLAAHRARE